MLLKVPLIMSSIALERLVSIYRTPFTKKASLNSSMNCARTAAKSGVKRYVEVSSGEMTNASKGQVKENDKVIPITSVAKYKYKVEKELKNIPNLNYTIVRPAIVYGIGDRTGLSMSTLIAYNIEYYY